MVRYGIGGEVGLKVGRCAYLLAYHKSLHGSWCSAYYSPYLHWCIEQASAHLVVVPFSSPFSQ